MADSLAAILESYGFDVRIERFDPWLPRPIRVEATLLGPERRALSVREPPAGSGAADSSAVLWNWMAYATNGEAEAEVVYANYGLPEDYAALDRAGIGVRGRIILARLGRSFRGVKVAQAEARGAAGLLLYPDPAGDGFGAGDTLPAGPYRPSWSVQRGTLMYMWKYTGDPLTPGRPAIDAIDRIDPADATNLPRIPVVAIGYADAAAILASLGGPSPNGFAGALDIGYNAGPGPARMRIASEQAVTQRPIYNVIATIPGSMDRPIILGNHFDAWVSGGADPHVGTAVTLEVARGLGTLLRNGWKPRRTIIIALWDAEEFGVVGSTEWVERHIERLSADAIAYFNIDTYTAGTLDVTGSPALRDLVYDAATRVRDPETGRTLAEEWAGRPRGARVGDIGAGSDWTAFLHHAGVPSLQWTMNGRGIYAVYHSSLDTFDYARRFVDPELRHAPALAGVMGVSLLRLAQADVLPFRYSAYADRIAEHLQTRRAEADSTGVAFDVATIRTELDRFRAAAAEAERQAALVLTDADAAAAAALNRALPRVETAFLRAEGLPGRPWYRHPLNAPGEATGYDALPLPSIAEAIQAGDTTALRQAAAAVVEALRDAANVLESGARD
ncbi:MAG: transferrin receptor-like dimerization domain-containing protein [Longimicrobiales bacterium]